MISWDRNPQSLEQASSAGRSRTSRLPSSPWILWSRCHGTSAPPVPGSERCRCEPWRCEQRQDALVSLPQDHAQELDDFGAPVSYLPVRGGTNRAVAGFLICAVVSAALAIAQLIGHHPLPHAVVVFGVIMGFLPVAVVGIGGFWHDKLAERDRRILFGAGAIGLVASCVLLATIGVSLPSD
jgi:hypothetical protein